MEASTTGISAAVFLLHTAATLAMTGVIWYVQLAHYPLFLVVGPAGFSRFEAEHVRRTTWVVAPLMLVEAGTLATLLALSPAWPVLWWSTVPLVLVWSSTAFLQVPLHRRLESEWSAEACRRLVATNWIRTISWSARAVLVLWTSGGQ